MLVCHRKSTNPYFNIAAEEYFIKQSHENWCMFWVNEPAVIIGKHQNAYSEFNYEFVKQNSIPVLRRISGGGAVYHDLGNINFSFIQHITGTNKINFDRFTSIIINMLNDFGVEAHVGKRNSIFVGDKKISGHAEHLFKDKILHHGTILYNTNLEALNKSLNSAKKFNTKALESARSEVTNITPLLPNNIDVTEFIETLQSWVLNFFPNSKPYKISDSEIQAIDNLVEQKYMKWEWNFGYSPTYSFDLQMLNHTIELKVKNGFFCEINCFDDEILQIISPLLGLAHREDHVRSFAKTIKVFLQNNNIEPEGFISCFF